MRIDYIRAYWDAIESGQETVGKWVRAWYRMVLDGLEDGRWFLDNRKAHRVIKFSETMCHHSKGRHDYIKLELWQKALVSVVFGIVDEDGVRQFNEIVLVVARKNGKTTTAAVCGSYILFCDDEYGCEIYCLAPKLEQARIVFDAAKAIVESEPELAELADVRQRLIYLPETASFMRAQAFASKKSDGYAPSCFFADEFGSWHGDAGLKQWEVMKSGQGSRRQPLAWALSTPGYEVDGIFDELLRRSTALLTGASKETHLAPFIYMIDDLDKWNDIEELKKSNPNLGVSITEKYLRAEIAVAEGSLSKRVEFLTKYACVRQNSSVAWLESELIEAMCGDPLRLEDFAGCYCVGGVDLSKTLDLTACCIAVEKHGEIYVFAKFFMPQNRLQKAIDEDGVPYDLYRQQDFLQLSGEEHVDYKDCYDWYRAVVEKYKLYPLKTGYDNYSSTYFVDQMKAYGFHLDSVKQGYNLTPVINDAWALIKERRVHIGNNNLLKIHFYNTALKTDTAKNRHMIVKIGTRTRIDGVAAFIDALTVRQKWDPEIGAQLRNKGK
ncbi:MAG: terminase large subunit [Clostridia bacterium]|nr:terminase large subunit [Clostridia bacterium]